MKPKSL